MLFIHRKLAGVYLLCAHLAARIDVRALLEPFLVACAAGGVTGGRGHTA